MTVNEFRQVLSERLDGDPALSELLDAFQQLLDEAYNDGHSKGHEEHSADDFWEQS